MIHSYRDHAANERAFLTWARTGLSAIALGSVVENGSLLALAIDPSSRVHAQHWRGYLGTCGSLLVGIGIAVLVGASLCFVRRALRIEDRNIYKAGVVRFALLLYKRGHNGTGADIAGRHRIRRCLYLRSVLGGPYWSAFSDIANLTFPARADAHESWNRKAGKIHQQPPATECQR